MAGYPISELKKASQAKGRDKIPIQQDGVSRQVELGVIDNAVKVTASTSSGVITKEGSFILQNNSAVINFTLDNAVDRELSDNNYVDSASAAAGDVHEYYWTGSVWTFHNVVTESRLNNALANYRKRYGSITELQNAKEVTITLVNGEDNTLKILDNLSAGEIFSDLDVNSRFGIPSSLGTYFILTFEKNVGNYAKVTAKSTTSSTVLVRYHNADTLSEWQKIATETDLKLVLEKTVTLAQGANVTTFNTNSAYLLVASGNNYRQSVCFISQGYNASVIKGVILANNRLTTLQK